MKMLETLIILNEIKTPTSFNDLAIKTQLSRGKLLGILSSLVRESYVKKEGNKYFIAAQGQIAIRETNPVDSGYEFLFYEDIDKFTGISANSLKEFIECLKKIDTKSLEFHLYRGDFEKWINDVFNDQKLAGEFAELKQTEIKGENLKISILKIVDKKFSELNKLTK